jgi:drug/metabolite transporter (DMT)-like permease
MNEYIAYLGLVILGFFLFFLGNLLLGKKNNGGKRFVICLAGAFLSGIGAIILLGAYKAGDWSEAFTWLVSAGGLSALALGLWWMLWSVKAKNEKVEKVFDSILGGI